MRAVAQVALGKMVGPAAEGEIRGEDGALLLVSTADDLQQQVRVVGSDDETRIARERDLERHVSTASASALVEDMTSAFAGP